MFQGRYSLAVSPEGGVTLPPAVRRKAYRMWGEKPTLLSFGAQFAYLCNENQAEALLTRIDQRLCDVFDKQDPQLIGYFRAMERSVAQISVLPGGRFIMPQQLMDLLGVHAGGLLTLLGVDDHLELWNRETLAVQTSMLSQKNQETRTLLETPICLQNDDMPCSLLKGGRPSPKRCGPCVYLRLP